MRKLIAIGLCLLPRVSFGAPAYEYDGLTSVMTGGTNDVVFNETDSFTMCAWIYPKNVGEGGVGRIFDRGASATLGQAFSMVATATLQYIATGGSDMTRASSNSAVTLNAWNYVCLTSTSAAIASANHIYVFNEKLVGAETTYKTTTDGASPGDNSAVAFRIGNNSAGSGTFLGSMRDHQYWEKRILTVAEMKESGANPGLVYAGRGYHWWEGAGNHTTREKDRGLGANTHDLTTLTVITDSTSSPKGLMQKVFIQ